MVNMDLRRGWGDSLVPVGASVVDDGLCHYIWNNIGNESGNVHNLSLI